VARPSFNLEDELDEWVKERLVPGQSKSRWYRYSVRTTRDCDKILDELFEEYEYEERREFILSAVSEKAEETKQKADRKPD